MGPRRTRRLDAILKSMRIYDTDRGRRRALVSAIAATLAVSCTPPGPVQLGELLAIEGEIGASTMLAIRGDAAAALVEVEPQRVTTHGPVCAGSVRVAADGKGGYFAAWWAPRTDSSAVVMVAAKAAAHGSEWMMPIVAESRDRGRWGCARPAPAIAADAERGYVHLAYFMDPPNGRGLYGGHSMEHGEYFHEAVAIVYGDRPVRASIATSGDLVAVAYEDPNSERARVELAVSATAGHIFEYRTPVTTSSMRATDPRVAVAGRTIVVAWTAEEWEEGARGSRVMARAGQLDERVTPVRGEEVE